MKWIGQHIWDFISRFRSKVYLEDVANAGSDTDAFLVKKADGEVAIRTGAEVLSDIGASSESTDLEFSGSTADGVLTYGGAAQIDVESTLTYGNNILAIGGAAETKPSITITNDGSTTSGGNIIFNKTTAGSDEDDLGWLLFKGSNASGSTKSFARFLAEIKTAANTDEAGKVTLSVATSDDSTSALQQALTATGHGTANKVDIGLGYGTASTTTIAGNLTTLGEDIFFQSETASHPVVEIQNRADDASAGILNFYNTRGGSDGQDSDKLGYINFYGSDDGTPSKTLYARIYGLIHDATNTEESGQLNLSVASHDGGSSTGLIIKGGSVDNEVDVWLGTGSDSLTTVTGNMHFQGDSITSTGALSISPSGLFKVSGTGVEIENGSTTGAPALLIDNNEIDEIALDINADNTSANIIDIDARALTTGDAIYVDANSLTTGGSILSADVDYAGTTDGQVVKLIDLDIDKSGNVASGEQDKLYGTYMHFYDSGTNVGNSTVYGHAVQFGDLNDGGYNYRTGYYVDAAGGDGSLQFGLYTKLTDGSTDLKFISSDTTTHDFFSLKTGASGETDITTVDGGGTAAHLNFNIDGSINMDAVDDITISATDNLVLRGEDDVTVTSTTTDGLLTLSSSHVAGQAIHIDGDANAGSIVDIDAGILDIDVTGDAALTTGGNYTVDVGTSMTVQSGGSSRPSFIVANNYDDATAPTIYISNLRDGNGLEDDDNLGNIIFSGADDGGSSQNYAKIEGTAQETGNTAESGKLELKVANAGTLYNGIMVEGKNTTAEEVDVTIANGSASNTTIAGKATIPSRIYAYPGTSDGDYAAGDIMYYDSGTASTTAGFVYYFNGSGSWTVANADAVADSTGMLAVALGTNPDVDGMLLRGFVTTASVGGTEDHGAKIYLSATDGRITTTAPGSGNVVRVMGYCLHNTNNSIYFNPDNSWVEVS